MFRVWVSRSVANKIPEGSVFETLMQASLATALDKDVARKCSLAR